MSIKRFDLRDLQAHPVDSNTGCINYKGDISPKGYGTLYEDGKIGLFRKRLNTTTKTPLALIIEEKLKARKETSCGIL
jgi:hypothetical protein